MVSFTVVDEKPSLARPWNVQLSKLATQMRSKHIRRSQSLLPKSHRINEIHDIKLKRKDFVVRAFAFD